MQKSIFIFLISFFLISCGDSIRKKEYKSPDELYGVLFKDVQLLPVFPDSKTFPDCIPRFKPEDIVKAYEKEKYQEGFNLKTFVLNNFYLPPGEKATVTPGDSTVEEYIQNAWPLFTRSPKDDGGSLIPLRKDYVVSKKKVQEINYHDAYFIMLGLKPAGKDTLMENMVLNFAQLIQDFGHVPETNRSYHLSHSHPPFFSLMIELLADVKKDKQIYARNTTQLLKEYQYWMASESKEEAIKQAEAKTLKNKAYRKVVWLENDQILNRYYDGLDTPRPENYKEDVGLATKSGRDLKEVYRHLRSEAESGWLRSPRWLKDNSNITSVHASGIIPVDLNALMYKLELALALAYRINQQENYAQSMENLAAQRKTVFNQYFWNEEKGFYFDYDFEEGKQKNIYSLAGVYPLFCGLASPQQAEKVARNIREKFLKPGGLITTVPHTKQSGGIGRASLQWIAVEGLKKYKYFELADEIRSAWVQNNLMVYKSTGKLPENIHVSGRASGAGNYAAQEDFSPTAAILLAWLSEQEMAAD